MSDFEEYVEEPARLLDPGAFDEHDPHHPHWAMEQRRDIARRRARLVLEQAGPRIAEDTRDRMVAAAARAIERTPPPFYYCPTSGEIEQTYEGGFTICCNNPQGHEPITVAALRAAQQVPR